MLYLLNLLASVSLQGGGTSVVGSNDYLTEPMKLQISVLADAYGTGPDVLQWPHRVIKSCPMLSKHILVHYETSTRSSRTTSFVVILSKELGKPFFLQLTGAYSRVQPTLEQHYAVATFNSVWTQEGHSRSQLDQMDWSAVASCYAVLTGDEVDVQGNLESPPRHTVLADPFRGSQVVLPLTPHLGHKRSLAVTFDKNGFILKAMLTVY